MLLAGAVFLLLLLRALLTLVLLMALLALLVLLALTLLIRLLVHHKLLCMDMAAGEKGGQGRGWIPHQDGSKWCASEVLILWNS